jgi:hypothetical protein
MNIKVNGIQKGANTHSHDQVMIFVNFKIKNIRNNITSNFNLLFILYFLSILYKLFFHGIKSNAFGMK